MNELTRLPTLSCEKCSKKEKEAIEAGVVRQAQKGRFTSQKRGAVGTFKKN
jgi:hypothetical protein